MERKNPMLKLPVVNFQFLRSNNIWKALLILISGLILTLIATYYTNRDVEKQTNQEFTSVCNDISIKISNRLHAHAQLLRSGAAFISASDYVNRKEWKTFIECSKIEKNLPGIQGVGYTEIISKNKLREHIQNMRDQGFRNYKIFPEGDRAEYSSIIYLEPFTGRNLKALGYDMLTEPIRRKAMELSRDADLAVLSGKVFLVQETDEDVQFGTMMYVPVYQKGMPVTNVAERRSAIKGWVYSPYRLRDLMSGILGRWDLFQAQRIHLQIYDDSISVSSLLYDSRSINEFKNHDSPERSLTQPIKFKGKKWVLLFNQYNRQHVLFKDKVSMVFVGGVLISFLLFLLSATLYNTRRRAIQIAEELTAESQRFRQALDQVHAYVYMKDPNLRYIYANRSTLELFGCTEEELKGKYDSSFFPPDIVNKLNEIDQRVFRGENTTEEVDVNGIDGDRRVYLEFKTPIYTDQENKKIWGLLGISTDITEHKQNEQILKNKNSELIRINSEKDKFFSIIAHDLRSPFNGFLGLTHMMAEELPKLTLNKTQQIASTLKTSATNLFRLLENLLYWARMQQGLIPFNPVVFNLLPIVYDCIALNQQTIKFKEIEVTHDIHPDLEVFADKELLQTILRNLVSNALKFTHKKGKLKITAFQSTDRIVEISVSDTGIGMSRKLLDDLFKIEVRSGRKGTEGELSTGLGLLLCKEFIEKHDGTIHVTSEETKGSTFSFTLPLKS